MTTGTVRSRRGFVLVLAMLFLVMFASIAAAYVSAAQQCVAQSENFCDAADSRLTAESGLAFMNYILQQLSPQQGLQGAALLNDLADKLDARLHQTPNLNGQSVTFDGATIRVPRISLGGEEGFDSAINVSADDPSRIVVSVMGESGSLSRTISMEYQASHRSNPIFGYGIASRSAISFTGNASVTGANNAAEANIYSSTFSDSIAVSLTGNAKIAGDISIANPSGGVSATGNVSVGGASSTSAHFDDHVHIGVDGGEFPEVDPTVFEPFATNIVDSHTSTSGNKTFKNIRIKAGTNPTFSGNITIEGVVFIEQPNQVKFSGNLNLTGVVVTEDAGDNAYATNAIRFTGNTSAKGVDQLPSTAEFAGIKQLPGAFLLAPGFGVEFTGNFGTVSGCMAADSFSFTGNAGGRIQGGIINYSDSVFSLTGNSSLIIDRSSSPAQPPGFKTSGKLSPDPSSYTEH